jgi:hypothetical protein
MAMRNENALARGEAYGVERSVAPAAFEPQTLTELVKFAEWMSDCELLPEHLRNKPKHFVLIAIKGREHGFTLMQSLACINVIKGRAVMNAEGIAAKVLQHPDCLYFSPIETTADVATYETHRRGAPQPVRVSFTFDMAKRAGLASNDNYRKHTEAMLRARAATALARAVFPDAVLGISEHGEAEEIAGRPVPVGSAASARAAVSLVGGEEPEDDPGHEVGPGRDPAAAWIDDQLGGERLVPRERLAALYCEAQDEGRVTEANVDAAHRALLDAAPEGTSPHALHQAIRVHRCELDYGRAKSLGEIEAIDAVSASLKLAKTSPDRKRLGDARRAAVTRLTPTPDGSGPSGGKPAPAANDATGDGHASGEHPAAPSAKATALDTLRGHLERWDSRFAIEHGLAKRLRAEMRGLDFDAALPLVAARLEALTASDGVHALTGIAAVTAARRFLHDAMRGGAKRAA